MTKPRIWYLPSPSHTEKIFADGRYQDFTDHFDVVANKLDDAITIAELEEHIIHFDGLVTGWGVLPLSETALKRAERLKIVVHSAGSVKYLFTPEMVVKHLMRSKIRVVSANAAIALNVAEHTIGSLIMMARRWIDHAINIRDRGIWKDPNLSDSIQGLQGSVVGVVSASTVGREVIRLLQPFDVRIVTYDPYLSDSDANRLKVKRVDLNTLFEESDMVTIHAPSISETNRMIGKKQLNLLKNNAVLINTSRGSVLDYDALFEEAKTGRILVQLDVTTPEPLPSDHQLRPLPNVVITPHTSGGGIYGMHKIGETTLTALEKFFQGQETIPGEVELTNWAQLA